MKVVTRVHGGYLYEDFSPIGFFPNRNFSISKINRIFTISNHGKNHLLEKFNINNVSVSKLGVISKNVISNSSNKFNFSVVSVSNIIPSKRVILIAHSIMQFSIENPNICVLWNHFGDGSDEKILKNLVNKCGIKNLKISLNGKVSNFEIFNFYANFSVDVLLNLSISEGIPVSMMEAISFGIPLIGTNVGGVSEIINSNTGLLLNDNPTIQIVVEALQSVYLNPPNRETIYNFYNSNFNGTNNYQKFALDLIEIHKSK
jgi:glycosyltransferase involved in cell wall biosynthesis